MVAGRRNRLSLTVDSLGVYIDLYPHIDMGASVRDPSEKALMHLGLLGASR